MKRKWAIRGVVDQRAQYKTKEIEISHSYVAETKKNLLFTYCLCVSLTINVDFVFLFLFVMSAMFCMTCSDVGGGVGGCVFLLLLLKLYADCY